MAGVHGQPPSGVGVESRPAPRGRLAARGQHELFAKDGARLWTKPLPSRAESSPLFDSGRIYFGSEDGTVYALDAKDGSVAWRYKASGAVKGGVALAEGRLRAAGPPEAMTSSIRIGAT